MKLLASIKFRIFITSWIIFTAHFATNVVREHYPAFSLVEHGTLKVDRYQGFHSDIFVHTDGHSYIDNNVAASVIAAIPLYLFHPILDMLERYEKRKIEKEGIPETVYRTRHTNSIRLLQSAQQNGLSLRFGGATMVTSIFLMAPLSALMMVLMFHILSKRQLPSRQAIGLTFLFGFGTPVFFRTGVLNHNMLLMYATFGAFYLLWVRPEMAFPVSVRRRLFAGCLCGLGLALDYSGVVPLVVLYGYLIVNRLGTASLKTSAKESIPFILGSIPPVLFLLYSQWSMFGNPFLPAQYWMPDVTHYAVTRKNPYSGQGFRGFTWPTLRMYFSNLFDPSYGMYIYGPLLIMAMIPSRLYRRDKLILPRPERRLTAIYLFLFLTFCAANQYSRLQSNSGFRYMVPLVPLIYLAVCDHLVRIPRRWLTIVVVPILLHSWVISMVREPVFESWHRVLTEGLQLPWLNVLRATLPENYPIVSSPLLPVILISLMFMLVFSIWTFGHKCEMRIESSQQVRTTESVNDVDR
ncbi:MAG: hypothetical protein P8Z79_10470 [Sedimentisphaerales bacterium]